MDNIRDKLYKLILDQLEQDYIIPYHETCNLLVKNKDFINGLNRIVARNKYDAIGLMELLYPLYKNYSKLSLKEWLNYIFDWTLSLSFPKKHSKAFDDKLHPLVLFYLNLLRIFCSFEIGYDNNSFLNMYPIGFLEAREEIDTKFSKEYIIFKDAFINNWIYELMKIDYSLTGHNTIDHVIGVNHLSLYISRQLKEAGLPIDLGIVVGAGLGHDIGKYGVKGEDADRVPYLHYYYTEKWFNDLGIEKTGHIAVNHSTWDLELENLPLESLILIYADFRVKNKKYGKEYKMHIYTLGEAYNVILGKLDNLDSKKEQRYDKVYDKLKDFENYMISLGIDIGLNNKGFRKRDNKPYPLMYKDEIIENFKYFAIEHNINLMAKLLDDISFNNILEMARSEYNWRKLRCYLQIFREYSTYLTQRQKTVTLHFLTDLLSHREEDIQNEAAELIGLLIANYDEEYRKEVPGSIKNPNETTSVRILGDLLDDILHTDYKLEGYLNESQYNLTAMIKSLFYNSRMENYEEYSKLFIKYYTVYKYSSSNIQLYLTKTLKYIPILYLNETDLYRVYNFIFKQLNSNILEIRLTVLDIIDQIYQELGEDPEFLINLQSWLLGNLEPSISASENYLRFKLATKLSMEDHVTEQLEYNYKKVEQNISEIFLKNLKTATEWMDKKVNIDILYDQVKKSPASFGLHTGMHFCNLLKVSAVEKVRNYAGHTLLHIYGFLSQEERNDIAIELLRALEMQSYQFTKYIPRYLGRLLTYLQPSEFDEIIDDFKEKIRKSDTNITFLLLKTVGVCIENYFQYMKRFEEDTKANESRIDKLLGLLLNGMSSFDEEIKTEAFRVIGSQIFASDSLSLDEKCFIFNRIGKKILTLLAKKEDDELTFLNNSAALNNIYRFIVDYVSNFNTELLNRKRIAFFPGSFDPFSLSHKKIATEIRDRGFEVHLAVDEFSWSKRTQAHQYRRNVINMTIAHERDIFLFPGNTPINISNDKDLLILRSLFGDKEIFMVVGTDVLINASAYKKDGEINSFNHIIYDRKSIHSENDETSILENRLQKIKGEIIRLSLPPQYEDISSSQIRESIDANRDISNQIDSLAQRYIYKHGLYLNEPQYKTLVETKTIEIEIVDHIDNHLIQCLEGQFEHRINLNSIHLLKNKPDPIILLIKETKNDSILGFSTLFGLKNSDLYEEFNNTKITEYLRRHSRGRLVLISGMFVVDNDFFTIETLLNETLVYCISSDYNYALFKNTLSNENKEELEVNLKTQGFIETPFVQDKSPIFMVDMNNPMTLSQDLEGLLKPPFDSNLEIKRSISKHRRILKNAISNLYPGELLLSFNRDMIYSKLIQKICDTNEVPIIQDKNRILGPNTCVPFGSILNGTILPNTITKTMHTEKIFEPNIKDFTIAAFPNYLDLANQARVLKSFNRPIILVDDLLHKGYRLNVIEPLLRNTQIEIKKVIVGILTGRGKEIGNIKNLKVDSAYFIPNLKLWFNESDLYPFMGGNMVSQNSISNGYLIPSINLVLPYVSPTFIKSTSIKNIYVLSETCLDNVIGIFKTIEKVYQDINEKNLIVQNIGEILVSPRKPDIYRNMNSINNLRPSSCLKVDRDHLRRIEDMVNR